MSAQEAPVGHTNGTSFIWNTRGQVIAAATVLPALGMISVALRLWARLGKPTGFGLDDAFMLPALVYLLFARQALGIFRECSHCASQACVIGLGITLLVGELLSFTSTRNLQ